MKTKVRLASRISDDRLDVEALKKAGWDEIEKTATPDPNDKSEKTLAEDGKRASDEPANARVVADQSEPVTSTSKEADRVIRREEIIENDGPVAEKKEEEESSEEEKDPFGSSNERVMAAFKLAELEEELGLSESLWNGEDKFARVASLETQDVKVLIERIDAYKNVKQAGLAKPKKKARTSLPPLATMSREAGNSVKATEDLSDYVIFS